MLVIKNLQFSTIRQDFFFVLTCKNPVRDFSHFLKGLTPQVLPSSEYYQPVRLPTDHQTILACYTWLALQAPPESAGSPLFPQKPSTTCRRCEPRKRLPLLAIVRTGHFRLPHRGTGSATSQHVRFRGYMSYSSFDSGLLSPCVRFACIVRRDLFPFGGFDHPVSQCPLRTCAGARGNIGPYLLHIRNTRYLAAG